MPESTWGSTTRADPASLNMSALTGAGHPYGRSYQTPMPVRLYPGDPAPVEAQDSMGLLRSRAAAEFAIVRWPDTPGRLDGAQVCQFSRVVVSPSSERCAPYQLAWYAVTGVAAVVLVLVLRRAGFTGSQMREQGRASRDTWVDTISTFCGS